MMSAPRPRLYLDNAATSWPKSPAVVQAIVDYLRDNGAPAGRSSYREAIEVDRQIENLRAGLARMIGADEPRRIIFTSNGTDSLNLALHGMLRPGDHVVTTDVEHNSVLRPLRWLSDERGVQVDRAACDERGQVDPRALARLVRPGQTRLVAVIHASNVTGTVQPLDEICSLAKAAGACLLVDAAQTLGQWPVDVQRTGIDLLAAPGHKSLGGPLGTGLLYVGPHWEAHLQPQRQGGTGTASQDDRQPATLPDRFESGNLNVPGLVGLAAAVAELGEHGVPSVQARYRELTRQFRDGLAGLANVRVYGPARVADQVGVVSLTIGTLDPQEIAATLDVAFGIQTRAGLHCAPRIHGRLGTSDDGGTVRFSWGRQTTPEVIDQALAAIAELAASV